MNISSNLVSRYVSDHLMNLVIILIRKTQKKKSKFPMV